MSGGGFRSRTWFRTSVCLRCSSKLSWKGWILVGNAASGLDREPEVRRNHSVEKDRQRNLRRRATSSSDVTEITPTPSIPEMAHAPTWRGSFGAWQAVATTLKRQQRTTDASSKASMFVGIAPGTLLQALCHCQHVPMGLYCWHPTCHLQQVFARPHCSTWIWMLKGAEWTATTRQNVSGILSLCPGLFRYLISFWP